MVEEQGRGAEGPKKPFDGFAKDLLTQELSPIGEVGSPAIRVAPEQYIDIQFVRTKEGETRHPLIGRLAGEGSLWEPFSSVPTLKDLRDNIEKHLAYHRDTYVARQDRPWDAPRARLWILSPSLEDPKHPIKELRDLSVALGALGFAPDEARGPGFWTLPWGFNVGVIVLDALPETDETVCLRLLGRGFTLERAARYLRVRAAQDDKLILQTLQLWGIYQQIFGPNDPWMQEMIMQLNIDKVRELVEQKLTENLVPQITQRVRAELEPQIRDEVMQQVKDEAMQQIKAEVMQQAKAELTQQAKAELTQQIKAELTQRVEAEVTQRVKAEVTQQVEAEVTQRIEARLRQELEAKIRQELMAQAAKPQEA